MSGHAIDQDRPGRRLVGRQTRPVRQQLDFRTGFLPEICLGTPDQSLGRN
jgi:hypothetical protein